MSAPATVQIHTSTFQRNTRTGEYRVRCCCGWFHFGTLEDCQTRAAVHDVEWQPVDPAPQPAMVR